MEAREMERIVQHVVEAIEREKQAAGFAVPVGVSARHVHLAQTHVEILFGEGYELTPMKALMGGQYACEEQVTLVGQKLRAIERVRVLGPARKASQVEISATDAIQLGIKAPIRESGDLAGTASVTVVGPKGALYLNEGCIVALRHIHMSPQDAVAAGVHDGQMVSVRTDGKRQAVLGQVKIRVDKSFTLEMHLDTDEANACGVATGDRVQILR